MNEKLKEKLMKEATGRKPDCADAGRLSKELGTPYAEAGVAADALGIKIVHCQPGCF